MNPHAVSVKNIFSGYGWHDYVHSPDGVLRLDGLRIDDGSGSLFDTAQSDVEQWYIDGWNEARRAEQEQGCVPFLLGQLTEMLDEHDEMDSDKARLLVQKTLEIYKKESKE